ncbi:MAG: phosphoenolpyruvate--protein phosphotransferase [Elusimicrobia bacterium]|nr:phosphoenolpyruvate--protein phosphotransferase [Elusimicrobiota bacterium]
MVFKGQGLSPGIAIGKVFLLERDVYKVHRRSIPPNEIKQEIARFRKSVNKVKAEILEVEKKVKKEVGTKKGQIFEGYRLFLEDRILIDGTENIIRKENVNAEFAFTRQFEKIVSQFKKIENKYIRERARDIEELGHRIMGYLLERKDEFDWERLPENSVIVARTITPADTTKMKKHLVSAFVTEVGGKTSHTAILARSLEIPAVSGVKDIVEKVENGDEIVVDGVNGIVIVKPDRETIISYTREKNRYIEEQHSLQRLVEMSSVTIDGKTISLLANIEIPEEIPTVLAYGAEGIGLYRTEFIFMNAKRIPTEEEQFEKYSLVCEKMLPHSVTIRTFDIGADKISESISLPPEKNSIMGLRAVRLYFKVPQLIKAQFRAILRASTFKNVKIMIPMIATVEEVKKVRTLFEEAKKELRSEGIAFDEKMPFGAMIEVPSAAINIDLIAKEVDFVSIGTNDLIQYVVAADRINENVSYLYNPWNPAVLRLIRNVIEVSHKLGKTVAMCGEMAGDPNFTKLLIGLGIDELSMTPMTIPKVKKIIRSITYKEAKEFARKFMEKF